MSYARFADDNWTSDVYCYHNGNGKYVTHVAHRRILGPIPAVPPMTADDLLDEDKLALWVQANDAQMEAVQRAFHEPITLPHAGETLYDSTLDAFLATLLRLRALGYRVPQTALDMINEETAELHR